MGKQWFIGALVFEHGEQNQGWSYFESLYFSYTTLLTIGYGDFEPMSNSGKPFFVFWSLLAIPTLTILISDMGDTVVKAIKDVTIYLGEITVLPSDEDTLGNRLKHGVYKGTLGQLDLRDTKEDVEKGTGDSESESGYEEMHPGLARIFRNARGKQKQSGKERKNQDRLAADFEETEKKDEAEARNKGEKWEEDEHHYRHVLIAQLRKVYADTQAATPKKYTYEEWQFFLKLLGEKEDDPSYHRKAPTHGEEEREANRVEGNDSQEQPDQETQQARADNAGEEYADGDDQVTRWSWIGAQSPLMGDKEEAEWLLERFFKRLEESLKPDAKTKQTGESNHYTAGLHNAQEEKDESSSSEKTMSHG